MFHCEITGGQPTPSYETPAVEFFGPNDLPPLSLGRTSPNQIHRFFDYLIHPDSSTDFD